MHFYLYLISTCRYSVGGNHSRSSILSLSVQKVVEIHFFFFFFIVSPFSHVRLISVLFFLSHRPFFLRLLAFVLTRKKYTKRYHYRYVYIFYRGELQLYNIFLLARNVNGKKKKRKRSATAKG